MEVNNRKTKKCPYCGKEIKAIAKKCRYCGEWLTTENNTQSSPSNSIPPSQKTQSMANEHENSQDWLAKNKKLILSIIAAIALAIIFFLVFGKNQSSNQDSNHRENSSQTENTSNQNEESMYSQTPIYEDGVEEDRETDSESIYTERVNNVVNSQDEVVVAFPIDERYSVYYFNREYGYKHLYYYDAKTDTHKAYEFPDLATGGYISDAWVSPSKKYIILRAEDRYADFMRIDTETNKLEYIRSCGTIRKTDEGYTIIEGRCYNEDEALGMADRRYAYTDYYYDEEGNYTGKHGKEYIPDDY
jgi:hypothetical protein